MGKKTILAVIPLILTIGITSVLPFSNAEELPEWIKNSARWWSEGNIDDNSYAEGLEFLINEGIIKIPPSHYGLEKTTQIPKWIKDVARWWSEGQVSDNDYLNAIQYMIEHGIISISFERKSIQTETVQPQKLTQGEKTILKLTTPNSLQYNGGQPIVFSGTLWTEEGERVGKVEIVIKTDGPCPTDGIITKGFTDKYGKFWIQETTKIWDESDNMITVHAEFNGNDKFLPSISNTKPVVVSPSHAEKCVN